MPCLREHLESPQLPEEEPVPVDDSDKPAPPVVRFTGGWVAAGQPRWKAYAIYITSTLGGILLVLTPGPGGLDPLAFGGLILIAFGVFGTVETLRGKRFPRP